MGALDRIRLLTPCPWCDGPIWATTTSYGIQAQKVAYSPDGMLHEDCKEHYYREWHIRRGIRWEDGRAAQ